MLGQRQDKVIIDAVKVYFFGRGKWKQTVEDRNIACCFMGKRGASASWW